MSKFLVIYMIIFMFIMFLLIFLKIKINITANNRYIIIEAIHEYNVDMINKEKTSEVCYKDMESFDETFKRYLDFGYTKILPKEKYEIIEPYIKKESRDD